MENSNWNDINDFIIAIATVDRICDENGKWKTFPDSPNKTWADYSRCMSESLSDQSKILNGIRGGIEVSSRVPYSGHVFSMVLVCMVNLCSFS